MGHVHTDVSFLLSNCYLTMKRFIPALIIILLVCSCNSQQKDRLPADGSASSEEAYPTAEEMLRDSIARKEDVGTECATICQRIILAEEMLSAVKSPDALISAKKEYLTLVASLSKGMSGITPQEQSVINAYKANLDNTYTSICREYEIPASGVISNLNNLIRRIDDVHTKSELIRFQDVRIGMLRKLDDIYLCVEHNSNKIPEIKRLSQTLKTKYENKKHEFGME